MKGEIINKRELKDIEEWSDYCEHCGTTEPPKYNHIYKGGLVDDSRPNITKVSLKVDKIQIICSACGNIIKEMNNE